MISNKRRPLISIAPQNATLNHNLTETNLKHTEEVHKLFNNENN